MAFTPTSLLSDAVYALDLLASLGQKYDIVGIYDAVGINQKYVHARPLKATVRETSKVMEHPVETGAMIADHRIINPVEIVLPMVIQAQYYAATYQQIKSDFLAATMLEVKTPVCVYDQMFIADLPHEESPEHFNAIILDLHLRQVLMETPGSDQLTTDYVPMFPANSNTVQSGLQTAASIGLKAPTAASSAASYASLIGRL